MEKQFNTAGPSIPGDHYLLDPLARVDLAEIESLIEAKRYFVLHAPRQTGKTTALLALMEHLNRQGRYRALYANIETAQAARGNVAEGMATIIRALASAAHNYWQDEAAARMALELLGTVGVHDWVRTLLERWSRTDARPIVLLLDEVDALIGDTLISLLRQIRAGYAQRPTAFPQTVVLCGVRDVRDYRIHSGDGEIITGGSAFNIKAASIRLG
ncbi:AAA family ATPase, partial [Tepidimonas alkaliphilus]|uniref:AAA family ATPase n=1 Tax=Tepidimonas alkaliphilus TaxID=2588942 RepID=UPI00117E8A1A